MGRKKQGPAAIKDPFCAFDDYFHEAYSGFRNELALRRILRSAFIAGVAWATAHQRICLDETLEKLNKWLADEKRRGENN